MGIPLDEGAQDHTTISRTRRLIDLETHQQVFQWVLKLLADTDLVKGKTDRDRRHHAGGQCRHAIDCAARQRGELRGVSDRSGTAVRHGDDHPGRSGEMDRKRKNKATNEDWENPHDPDAKITKMKDGRTHLAHKAEHAVDMETGAVLAVTMQEASLGDTTTVKETLAEAGTTVDELIDREAEASRWRSRERIWTRSRKW